MSAESTNRKIEPVAYEEARAVKLDTRDLILRPQDEFHALRIDGRIVSFLSLAREGRHLKVKANYTLPEYRRRGLFSELLAQVLAAHEGDDVRANCLPASVGIYRRAGFTPVSERQYKNFKVFCLRREPVDGSREPDRHGAGDGDQAVPQERPE